MACNGDASTSRVRLALGVITTPTRGHLRCFQRATLRALAAPSHRAGAWYEVLPTQHLLVRYVISHANSDASLARENATHLDLLDAPIDNNEATCFAKIVWWLARGASLRGATHVGMGDDDMWVHPARLLADLAPFAERVPMGAHAAAIPVRRGGAARADAKAPHVHTLFGTVSWTAGWNNRTHRHHGYANGNALRDVAVGHEQAARRGNRGIYGPFPFANGFMMVLNRGLAAAVGRSRGAAQLADNLAAAVKSGRRPHQKGKCDPAGDGSLGHAIANLRDVRDPVALIDLTSTERVHFWRSRATYAHLRDSLSVLHGAHTWADTFQWATCVATAQDEPTQLALQPTPSPTDRKPRIAMRPFSLEDRAPKLQCMPLPAKQHNFPEGSTLTASRKHGLNVSAFRTIGDGYFAREYRDWLWCARSGFQALPTPRAPLRDGRRLCNETSAAVLEQCAAGF